MKGTKLEMARTTKKTATNNSTEIETVTGPLTADTVNRIVWRACDTFRGVVEPSSYKDYILTMLFVKYLTDMRDEAQEKFREQYKGDEERVERAMSKQRFILPPKSDFHFLKENSKSAQLGDLINKLLARISDANRGKLEDVFRDIDFNSNILGETKDRNTRLQHLVDDFSNKALDLRSTSVQGSDVIGNAYEFLIGHFAAESGKSGGEFYTPKEVAPNTRKHSGPQRRRNDLRSMLRIWVAASSSWQQSGQQELRAVWSGIELSHLGTLPHEYVLA